MDANLKLNREKYRSQITTITPEMAAEWLARYNRGNRPIRMSHVETLARDMAAGQWLDNGETIVFDRQHNLIDGQHRLTACGRSGKPFTSLVVYGADPDSVPTYGLQAPRKFSDYVHAAGAPSAVALAAAVALMWRVEMGYYTSAARKPSGGELAAVFAAHPGLRDGMNLIGPLVRRIPASMVLVIYHRFRQIDPGTAERFFVDLISGAGLTDISPVLHLREMLARNAVAKRKVPIWMIHAWTIKAWNAYRANIPVRQLKFAEKEPFPEPR